MLLVQIDNGTDAVLFVQFYQFEHGKALELLGVREKTFVVMVGIAHGCRNQQGYHERDELVGAVFSEGCFQHDCSYYPLIIAEKWWCLKAEAIVFQGVFDSGWSPSHHFLFLVK